MTKEQLTHLFERANEQVELLRTHKYEFIDSHLDNIEREMHEFVDAGTKLIEEGDTLQMWGRWRRENPPSSTRFSSMEKTSSLVLQPQWLRA